MNVYRKACATQRIRLQFQETATLVNGMNRRNTHYRTQKLHAKIIFFAIFPTFFLMELAKHVRRMNNEDIYLEYGNNKNVA